MFFACGIWCLADVSSVSPSSEQTLLIKPIFRILAHAEKQGFFFKTGLPAFQLRTDWLDHLTDSYAPKRYRVLCK